VTLAEELAVEPGADLRRLHQELHDSDRVPAAAPARSWLPRAVADFTGRAEVVKRLTTTPDRGDVWVIDGGVAQRAGRQELATIKGFLYLQGRALVGLADCDREEQPDAARRVLERALAKFTRMDIPVRHEVARQLDELRERALAAAC
jgi:hypothetical protein